MSDEPRSLNFIEEIIEEHARTGRFRRAGANAVSAGAEWVFAHRACQKHLPEFWAGDQIPTARAICGSTTPIPTKEEEEYVKSIEEDVRWLGFHVPPAAVCQRLFRADSRLGHSVGESRQGVCLRFECRPDSRIPRHADHAGKKQPVPRSAGGGESRSVRADAQRGISRGLAHAAGESRHGPSEFEHARPGDVPHFVRRASSHRQPMVHLSDVRLGPRAKRFD